MVSDYRWLTLQEFHISIPMFVDWYIFSHNLWLNGWHGRIKKAVVYTFHHINLMSRFASLKLSGRTPLVLYTAEMMLRSSFATWPCFFYLCTYNFTLHAHS